jgi:hypothetical protein
LAVDSFATRGIKGACASQCLIGKRMRWELYLSKLAFVDPKRTAVLGSSQVRR